MADFELEPNETVFSGWDVTGSLAEGSLRLTLTSERIVFESGGFVVKSIRHCDVTRIKADPKAGRCDRWVSIKTLYGKHTLAFRNQGEAQSFIMKARREAWRAQDGPLGPRQVILELAFIAFDAVLFAADPIVDWIADVRRGRA